MTPGARIAAAAEILDTIAAGRAAEPALAAWARGHRFAGSGDRAAIRDHVFDALRRRRSAAAMGGGDTGRALMIGLLRLGGRDPAEVFTGEGHAPAQLSAAERAAGRAPRPGAEAGDVPDWLYPHLEAALGAECDPILAALRTRAPVHLRVNLRKARRDAVAAELAARGIATLAHPLSPTALEVTEGARRVRHDPAYRDGLVELQDAASQAVADFVPVRDGDRFLDYCAGGGGKTLAVAARAEVAAFAHDAAPRRMADLPARAARAGVAVTTLATAALAPAGPFDAVLCDAPCSGSGSWRRDPGGKWALTPDRLAALTQTQDAILADAAPHVAPGGALVYATCSLLAEENEAQIAAFLFRHDDWRREAAVRLTPLDGGDGFFVAVLRHVANCTC